MFACLSLDAGTEMAQALDGRRFARQVAGDAVGSKSGGGDKSAKEVLVANGGGRSEDKAREDKNEVAKGLLAGADIVELEQGIPPEDDGIIVSRCREGLGWRCLPPM